jgi:DNA-binding MarR family transcriptional regulator
LTERSEGAYDHGMTPGEATFVEEMGQFLGSSGMTPMAGRMWAWLLICDPPEQTASDLATELHASRGAISGTARMLESARLIRRTRRRGDRREYFTAPAGALEALLSEAGTLYGRFRSITEDGLAVLADRPPAASARLVEVHAAFAFFEREYPALIARYLRERAPAEISRLDPLAAEQDVPA